MDNIVHVRVLYYPWSYKLPPFELRATPQLYGMCYLTESSVKLETLSLAQRRRRIHVELTVRYISRYRELCMLCERHDMCVFEKR